MKVSRFCLFLVVMADTPKSAREGRQRRGRRRRGRRRRGKTEKRETEEREIEERETEEKETEERKESHSTLSTRRDVVTHSHGRS